MSIENRNMLQATIYNMTADASPELFDALAALSDEELETELNTIMSRGVTI